MKFSTFIAGLGAAWLLAGGAQAHDTVRLGKLDQAQFGALAYTTELAPQCGLRIAGQRFADGAEVIAALRAGRLDAGASTVEAAIAGRAGGAPIFIVAGVAKGGARLLARPGHKLRQADGLKGKKLGVARGGIEELLLREMLIEQGAQPGRDATLVYLPASALNAALAARRIDAMMQSAPFSSQAIASGAAVEAFAPQREPVHVLLMSEAFYLRQRAVAEKFMRCFVGATRIFIEQPALAHNYVRDVVFQRRYSDAEVRHALAIAPYGDAVSEAHVQALTEAMQQSGFGALEHPPPPRLWMRTDLLEAARKGPPLK